MSKGNYIITRDWMMTELGLSNKTLLVYGIIYGVSSDGKGSFNASINWLAQLIKCSERSINRAISRLLEAGLIIRQDRNRSTGGTNVYTVNFDKIPKEDTKKSGPERNSDDKIKSPNEETLSEGTTNMSQGERQTCRTGYDKHVARGTTNMSYHEVNNKINNNLNSVSIVNSCRSKRDEYDTHERDNELDSGNFDKTAYLNFIQTYSIVIDSYNSEIANMDFDKLCEAYEKSRKYLQSRPYCRTLSWICNNYKRILTRYYEDYNSTQNCKLYTPEEEAELDWLNDSDETVPY